MKSTTFFKKKIALILIFVLTATNIIFASDEEVIIHYKKLDGYYNDLVVHIESNGQLKKEKFNYTDEFGVVLKTKVPFNPNIKISIIDSNKKTVVDEFTIDMYKGNEIWKVENDENLQYVLPYEYNSMMNNTTKEAISLYYKRYDQDYNDLKVIFYDENGKEQQEYDLIPESNYSYIKFEMEKTKPYFFKIYKDDEIIDFENGVIYPSSINEDNKIYLLQDKDIPFYDSDAFYNNKYIEDADLNENGEIIVKLFTPDKMDNTLNQGFEVSVLNGEKMQILYVEPMNLLEDNYCDTFKVAIKDIDVDGKYTIEKEGYGKTIVSKNLLYDTDEFNNDLKDIKNLGFNINDDTITFNLFYPNAEKVTLNIYDEDKKQNSYPFEKVQDDVWSLELNENLVGKSYDYEVFLGNEIFTVNEPIPKIKDEYGRSVIFEYDDYIDNKDFEIQKKYYNAIYTEPIDEYMSFKKLDIPVIASMDKSVEEIKKNKSDNSNTSDNVDEDNIKIPVDEKDLIKEDDEDEEEIEEVQIKYFEYTEGMYDNIEDNIEVDEDEEVVPTFSNVPVKPIGEKQIEVFENVESDIIDEFNADNINQDLEYTHFYFDYENKPNLIKIDENVNKIKQFVNDVHQNNRKIIFKYSIDTNELQYICDNYYFEEGKFKTNREIVKTEIIEDMQHLKQLYNIDGFALDLNYFDKDFLIELQKQFNDLVIVGYNGDNSNEFYSVRNEFSIQRVNSNDLNNIYKITGDDAIFELVVTLISKSIPLFYNLNEEDIPYINEILESKNKLFEDVVFEDYSVINKNDNTILFKVGASSSKFDYYTVGINFGEDEEVIKLPTRENTVVVDNFGIYKNDNKKYESESLLLQPKSVYVLKSTDSDINLNNDYTNIIILVTLLFLIIIFITIIFKIRNKKKRIFL